MGLRQALGRDVRVGSFRPMPLAAWLAAGLAVLDIASTLLMLVLGTRAGQRHWERHHHWRHDAGDGHHWRHNESGQAEGGADHGAYIAPESFRASVAELCALLLLRVGAGCAILAFFWPRSFLGRPRRPSSGFSVRFFCEAALALCALACALKVGLVLAFSWPGDGGGQNNPPPAHADSGSGSSSGGSDTDYAYLEGGTKVGTAVGAAAGLGATLPVLGGGGASSRLPVQQRLPILAAAVLATVCSTAYLALCRVVGNRNGRRIGEPEPPSWFQQQRRVYHLRNIIIRNGILN
jgi:hypothetical protein